MSICQEVDAGEFERPTVRVSVDVAVGPGQLFEILEDSDAWPRWLTALDDVTWTSSDPKGVGTTRTVTIGGNFIADEEFIVWEADRRMAFRFTTCSRAVFRAFAEDYRIVPTDNGCRLTWSVVARPRILPAPLLKIAAPILAVGLRRYLANLQKYAVARFSLD